MESNVQDRTREFQQCVSTFERQSGKSRYQAGAAGGAGAGAGGQGVLAQDGQKLSSSEFSRQASTIAKEIARVTSSLASLAQLAKKKQLFNDRPTDIIELTYVIKQDIFRIEKQLKLLQKSAASSAANGGRSDQQIQTNNKNVVQLLNTKTKNISEAFKEVLQVRQRNELAQRSRQEQLLAAVKTDGGSVAGGSTVSSSGRPSMESRGDSLGGSGGPVPYALRSRSQNGPNGPNGPNGNAQASSGSENPFLASLSNGNTGYDGQDPEVSEPADLLALPDQTKQMLLMEEQDSRYLQERSHAVETIESTINEVGGLFQQLATMVQEQGEVIQRIDNNVEDVSLNISGAHRELLKYYNNISSNRWLMVKIFGILLLFFMLWVLVS